MQGYKLNEGQYKKDRITANEMWDSFNWLFSSCSKNDTSYKFLFLKSIIDCIDKKDSRGRISFDVLFDDFTRLAWNLVLKYDISQKAEASDGRRTALENVLKDFCREYVPFNELFDQGRKKICHKVKMECSKYVVGALYGDTDGLLYSFSKKEEWIELNPMMEKFIKDNKGLIEDLNYYKWAKFYERVNGMETIKELEKAYKNSMSRENETIYRSILAFEFELLSVSNDAKSNTLELLFEAINIEDKNILDEEDIQDELYKDCSHMKMYIKDPIQLVTYIKKKKEEYYKN